MKLITILLLSCLFTTEGLTSGKNDQPSRIQQASGGYRETIRSLIKESRKSLLPVVQADNHIIVNGGRLTQASVCINGKYAGMRITHVVIASTPLAAAVKVSTQPLVAVN